mmetsp:Transcript_5322/g.19310  ORF Transcript_5322/g.19310 Transcript_5322/m.19310 type:complete len:232 (+) Transcript_5322:568-1263(+)
MSSIASSATPALVASLTCANHSNWLCVRAATARMATSYNAGAHALWWRQAWPRRSRCWPMTGPKKHRRFACTLDPTAHSRRRRRSRAPRGSRLRGRHRSLRLCPSCRGRLKCARGARRGLRPGRRAPAASAAAPPRCRAGPCRSMVRSWPLSWLRGSRRRCRRRRRRPQARAATFSLPKTPRRARRAAARSRRRARVGGSRDAASRVRGRPKSRADVRSRAWGVAPRELAD